jgi:hypothetical protein
MNRILSRLLFRKSQGSVKEIRRFMAASGLIIAIVAAACFLWLRLQSATPHAWVGLNRPLPSLIVDSSGVTVDLREFAAGARRIIVFYSPACHTCREVLPALHPFPPNLRLLMVNVSSDPNNPETSSFPSAALFHDRWHAFPRSVASVMLPTFLFVDSSGILRDGLIGKHDRKFVQQKVKEFAIQSSCGSRQP